MTLFASESNAHTFNYQVSTISHATRTPSWDDTDWSRLLSPAISALFLHLTGTMLRIQGTRLYTTSRSSTQIDSKMSAWHR